ncbi:MAG: O-antigen translocase [Bacteroidetes bacterium]|nr:O-antigen translocase [Bacteroidota bacterium]
MKEQQSSYRQIMKATSIFGGVQIFHVIISIIRSKFIAVLLGPAGMGIAGLLTSTTNLVGSLTNMGLKSSAVRNIAAATTSGNNSKVGMVVSVFRRLVWMTGILGTLITLILAPWLSELTFGNRDYTLAFIWISITLLLTQIKDGQLALLQGMRKLQYLAKANLAGTTSALVISIPVYYFLRLEGIVPAIIITSLAVLFFSWIFASKIKTEKPKVTRTDFVTEGSDMLRMGIMLSLSSITALATSYLARIYISHRGGVEQVGLFNAGFAIVNSYVGMVFTAMGTDYFPRLSSYIHDRIKAMNTVNNQAEIAILILAPIITIFLVFIKWVVILFYSTKFIGIHNMIHFAVLGMFFKAISWPISYIFIAKGHTKLFFYSELIANIYFLGFKIIGYRLGGLDGIGIAFLINFFLYFVQVYIIAKKKYDFSFTHEFSVIFRNQLIIGILCFLCVKLLEAPYLYIIGTILIMLSVWYSLKELNKRMNLILLIKEKYLKGK